MPHDGPDWKHHGVRVIPGTALDANTAQTPGMSRAAAITHARVGAEKLWAGTVTIHAHAKTRRPSKRQSNMMVSAICASAAPIAVQRNSESAIRPRGTGRTGRYLASSSLSLCSSATRS